MIYFVFKIDCYLRSASCLHAEIGVGESESDPLPVSHTLNHVGDLERAEPIGEVPWSHSCYKYTRSGTCRREQFVWSGTCRREQIVSRQLRSKAERDSGLKGGGRGRERKILALRSEELQYRQAEGMPGAVTQWTDQSHKLFGLKWSLTF